MIDYSPEHLCRFLSDLSDDALEYYLTQEEYEAYYASDFKQINVVQKWFKRLEVIERSNDEYSVVGHGLAIHVCTDRPYEYVIEAHGDISDYGMEQQGNIIADYCMAINGFSLELVRQLNANKISSLPSFAQRYNNYIKKYSVYELSHHQKVLSRFLSNPQDTSLLPIVLKG